MAVQSNNDWDPLEEIFVGTAKGAVLPTMNASVRSFSYATYSEEELNGLEGPHDKQIMEEAEEDLDILSDTLTKLGVKVHRPTPTDHSVEFSSPDWSTTGWYSFCPRDLLLPLDNMIIECSSPMRARQYETRVYYDYLYQQMKEGTQWIKSPTPILKDDLYQFDDLSVPTVKNNEIVWEAPNVVRLGKDLLYQHSNTGSILGYEWLKTIVEPRGYRLHLAEDFYFFAHFDSTVIPLRPGLVMFNAERCTPDHYPKIFEKWDKIFVGMDDLVAPSCNLPNGVSPCSPWIGMNLLSINENCVVIDKDQEPLMRILEKHGIESVACPARQARSMSGGFHCNTLDVKRKGGLESYFD